MNQIIRCLNVSSLQFSLFCFTLILIYVVFLDEQSFFFSLILSDRGHSMNLVIKWFKVTVRIFLF